MDPEDVKILLRQSGADLWSLIEGAVALAANEHAAELRRRRDGIVELIYGSAAAPAPLRNFRAEENGCAVVRSPEMRLPEANGSSSPATPQSFGRREADEEEVKLDDEAEDEQVEVAEDQHEDEEEEDQERKILAIRDFLEDLEQPEDSLIQLLQNLADMDITFKALKETDIGKYVSALKKHTSSEVRRLSKQLIKKWKDMVDDWARENKPVSPSIENRSSISPERQSSTAAFRRGDPPARSSITTTQSSAQSARPSKEQEDSLADPDRLEVARKRLHMNYQRKADEKKQRTIQVMELTDIPRGKNTFIARNKGAAKNHRR